MASPVLARQQEGHPEGDPSLWIETPPPANGAECDSGIFSIASNKFSSSFRENGASNWSAGRIGGEIFAPIVQRTTQRRLVDKNGRSSLIRTKIPSLWTAYIRDIGNTLVNSRWRWTIICFASSHLISWLLFAWFYMLTARDNESSDSPCLVGINSFTGYFLFSLETQHTIGYGTRFITENCPVAIFLISLQMIMGVAICGGMVSIIYTKMIRPHSVHITSLFSKTAVICQRDGIVCLIFRVRDENNKHRVQTKIEAHLVENRQNELSLKTLALEKPGFLIWPLEIVHPITFDSPFWDLSAKDLITRKFELIVSLEGVSVTAGQFSKIRTSYLSNEILWGHRFKPCVKFDNEKQVYYINEVDFNTTEEVVTPLCSAKRLQEVAEEIYSPVPSSYSICVGSPTVSSPREDFESSGIGSLREEDPLTPPDSNRTTRKLSVIREYKSEEHIIKVGEIDVHCDPVGRFQHERTQSSANLLSARSISSNHSFDIDKLLENLQSYLDENSTRQEENADKPARFCETNF